VAGEVAKEVEGSPLMLAAEVQEEAADAVLTRADVSSDAYTEASTDEGESQPFEADETHPAPADEPETGESPDEGSGPESQAEAESGQPDAPTEPSGDPDASQDDDA
jgi:hypothetical protein